MIISSSNNLYNWQEATASATLTGETTIQAMPTLVVRNMYGSATFTGETVIAADGHAIQAGASVFRGATQITARANTRIPLVDPEPILNEVAAGAFAKQYYTARLLDNSNNEIKFTSASIEAPRGSIGRRVSINVAKKDLSLITNAKTYTFQIGTRETPLGAITWHTIVENGSLNSRSFGLAQNGNLPADTLSFGTIEPLKNRLNKFPKENLIIYNSRRTSVEIASTDVIRDTTGAAIGTNVIAINYMTLRDVLELVRKLTGFSAIVTNIPNFEMTRADFPITASYLQSLSGIIGIFEPVIFTVGSELYILDKTAAIPEEFTPRAIQNAELSNWSISIPAEQEIDGFLVSHTADDSQANYYTERLAQKTDEPTSFGSDDYTRTETEIKYREWRSFAAPDEILRSEIISIKRETYIDFLTVGSSRTELHNFDAQGRRAKSQITMQARVPDLSANGAPSLQTVREIDQTISYTTDPKNPRKSLQSKVQTTIRGLIAVNEEIPYFDPDTGEESPFKQDYIEAHKPGNLTLDMTTSYGALKRITKTLIDLGNGQYEMSVSIYDFLRKTETDSFSEPVTGDATLLSSLGKQSQIQVLKEGLTQETRPGNELKQISIGELPLYFGIPLTERKIARHDAQKQSGTATAIGWNESIERGTFFTLYERENNYVGKFLTVGYRADITAMGDGAQILTLIEADEI